MKNIIRKITLFSLLTLTLSACGGGGGKDAPSAIDPNSPPDLTPGGTGASLGQVVDSQGNTVAAIFSNAVDINDSNEVIGFASTTLVGNFTAALWAVNATGQATVAPTSLAPLAGNTFSAASSIDNAGNVVGQSAKGSGRVAVLWRDGAPAAPVELPALATGDSAAYGISPDGSKIVGEATDATGTVRAVLWRVNLDGSIAAPQILPTNIFAGNFPVAFSSASDVNDFGFIVGEVEDGNGVLHAVVWEPGTGTVYTAVDLSTGIEAGSTALGINASGQVVGESHGAAGATSAILWNKTVTYQRTPIVSAGSAGDISDSGRIAGWETVAGVNVAAVWNTADLSAKTNLFTGESQAYSINVINMVVGRSGSIGFIKRVQ